MSISDIETLKFYVLVAVNDFFSTLSFIWLSYKVFTAWPQREYIYPCLLQEMKKLDGHSQEMANALNKVTYEQEYPVS